MVELIWMEKCKIRFVLVSPGKNKIPLFLKGDKGGFQRE
ncbi:hypothetical protein ADICYQ_5856 [Cyclobacterium qasimii M12-11B]|uniref:Uncharacterized protein n=1 Tax=Cyclobacterium qasimii M12-11B TaxID=641524 RepID=S7WM95_9BACT|nr:hypothetical protein ADICYQ_5856 [Cyclobacterium qasimii M12-11B]